MVYERCQYLSYLEALMSNKLIDNLKKEIKDSKIEQKIKLVINKLTSSFKYNIKMLSIIRPILTIKNKSTILENIKIAVNSASSIHHDLLPWIIHLSNGDVNLYDMIKRKILNQKDIWPTAMMGYSTFPYYAISKRISFQTGIIWTKTEIEKIFENLKNSLKKIEMFEEQLQQEFQNSFLIPSLPLALVTYCFLYSPKIFIDVILV